MNTYIAFLRGINVSGQKKILMADFRVMVEKLGYGKVRTYIQSGNVVFESEEPQPEVLEKGLEEAIYNNYGFEVPTMVLPRKELRKIMDGNPYNGSKELEGNKVYFVLLKDRPSQNAVQNLEAIQFEGEQFTISERCVYLYVGLGMGKAKCSTNFFEKKLEVVATARNHRTMNKLLALSTF